MSGKEMSVTEALAQAIKAERDGHSFYTMAAASTQDEQGREIFTQLAAEELDHMHFLTRHYQALVETGKPDPTAKLGAPLKLEGMSPIFSDGIRQRIQGAHLEMSALAIGVQLEQDAAAFYRAQSEAADDPQIKQFFSELSDWETAHYRALLHQQEQLKDDYWTGSNFSAF